MACMMFDEERSRKQRRPTSNVTVRYFASTQQPTRELDRRTSSDCTCLGGTHVGENVRTRYRVGQGLRLPIKKTMNVF